MFNSVKRDFSKTESFATCNFCTIKTPGDRNTNTFDTGLLGSLHSLLHSATEWNTAFNLLNDVIGDYRRISVGVLHLADVNVNNRRVNLLFKDSLKLFHPTASAANNHTRTRAK